MRWVLKSVQFLGRTKGGKGIYGGRNSEKGRGGPLRASGRLCAKESVEQQRGVLPKPWTHLESTWRLLPLVQTLSLPAGSQVGNGS